VNTVPHHFYCDVRETLATVLAVHPTGEFEADHRPSVVLSDTVLSHLTESRAADRGWIEDSVVVNVTKSPIGEVHHHHDGSQDRFRPGQLVRVQLDLRLRELNARLLSAGRLLELVGPRVVPGLQLVSSCFMPHCSAVHFGAGGALAFIPDPETVWADFNDEVETLIALDLPVKSIVVEGASFRQIQFGALPAFPCSGAYPRSLKMIGKVSITKIVNLGGRLQVRYGVQGPTDKSHSEIV